MGGNIWKKGAPSIIKTSHQFFVSQRILLKGIFQNSCLDILLLFAIIALGVYLFRLKREPGNFRDKLNKIIKNESFNCFSLLFLMGTFGYILYFPMYFPNLRYYLPIFPSVVLLGLYGIYYITEKRKFVFVLLIFCLFFLSLFRFHWYPSYRFSQLFPQPLPGYIYKILVYEDAKDRRPKSYSGEASLVYTDLLASMKDAAQYIENNYSDKYVVSGFPICGYLIFPLQGMVHEPIKQKTWFLPGKDCLAEEDIILTCSLSTTGMETLMAEAREYFHIKMLKRFERHNQWVEIYRVLNRKTDDVKK
jgi:hypothetical protein